MRDSHRNCLLLSGQDSGAQIALMQARQSEREGVFPPKLKTCSGRVISQVPLRGKSGRTRWFPKKQRHLKVTEIRAEKAGRGDGGHTSVQGADFSRKVSPGAACWACGCDSALPMLGVLGSITARGTKTPPNAVKKHGIPNANTKTKHSQVNNKSWGVDAIHDCS